MDEIADGLTHLGLENQAELVLYTIFGATIIIVFVSPITGILLGNTIKNRTALAFGLASSLGIFSGLFAVLNHILPDIIGEDIVDKNLIAPISLVIAFIIAVPIGIYITWQFSTPKSDLDKINYDNDFPPPSLPSEAKRHERMRKRKRR